MKKKFADLLVEINAVKFSLVLNVRDLTKNAISIRPTNSTYKIAIKRYLKIELRATAIIANI